MLLSLGIKSASNQLKSHSFNNKIVAKLQSYSDRASIVVIAIGCMVLLGWLLNIDLLKTFLPGLQQMKINTAIGMLLSGISLRLWHKREKNLVIDRRKVIEAIIPLLLPIIVIAIGLLTIMQYSLHSDFGIDQLLFPDVKALHHPGRMAPNTAINFVLMGSALLLLYRKVYQFAQSLSIATFLIAFLGLLGYVYNVPTVYAISKVTGMAIHTASSFILLSLGVLFATPTQGLMRVAISETIGGMTIRLLIPYALMIPPISSGLALILEKSNLVSPEGGLAILAVFNIFILILAIWWNGRSLTVIDDQRLQLLSELKINQERLQLAMMGTQAGLWDWNIITGEIYFSPELLKLSGYIPGELAGNVNTLTSLVHSDDLPQVMARLNSHLAGVTPSYQAEFRLRKQSGEYHWIMAAGQVVEKNSQGQPMRITGTHQDITQRKELELEQQKLFAIIENSPDFIGLADLDGNPMYLNINGQKLIGLTSLKEAKTKNMSECFLAEDLPKVYQEVLPTVMQTGTWKGELHFVHFVTGEVIPVEYNVFLVKNSDTEEPIGLGTITSDIRERKRNELALQNAQKELAKKQAIFDAYFNASPAGMTMLDHELKFIQINPILANFGGLPMDEYIGKNIWETLPETAPSIEPIYRQVLETNQPVYNVETPVISETELGLLQYWLSSYFPLHGEHGEVVGVGATILNISDRKRAEEERDRFFNISADLLCIAGFDGNFKRLNSAWSNTLGYSLDALTDCPFLDFVHPDDLDKTREVAQLLTQGQTLTFFENRYRCQDGSYKYLSWKVTPDLQQDLMYAVARDVTQEKENQEKIKAQEEFLRSIYEGVEEGIFVVDLDAEGQWRFLGWNPVAEKTTGISSKFCRGKTPVETFGATVGSIIQSNYDGCLQSEQVIRYEESFITEGQVNWSLTTLKPIRNLSGQIYRIIGASWDITDRKLAEEKRRTSEERLNLALQGSDSGLWDWNIVTGYDYFSPEFAAILGYDIDELEPHINTWQKILHPDCLTTVTEALNRHFADPSYPYTVDQLLLTKSGAYKWIFASGKVIERDEDGQPIRMTGIIQDISDRKLAEAQIQQMAQQESFINSIANQIRSSLNLPEILGTAVREIRNLLGLDSCLFIWFIPDLEPPAWHIVYESKNENLPSLIGNFSADLTKEVTQKVSKLESSRIDDVNELKNPEEKEFFKSVGCISLLNFPMQTPSGKIGVVACSFTQARVWQDREVELLKAIGVQLEIAISQAELYEQTQVAAREAEERSRQIEETLRQLQQTQTQLIQAEKMSSLGQLVSGIAHEINNPVSFIFGNIEYTKEYSQDLFKLLDLYQTYYPDPDPEIVAELQAIDLDYLKRDFEQMLTSMKTGATRIRDIVISLRTFSRLDEAKMKAVDLHEGLDSTLLILESRLMGRTGDAVIEIIKCYGNLPTVECYAGEINQVFMNILVNAIDALQKQPEPRYITITTEIGQDRTNQYLVKIKIADNGPGISDQIKQRIFDPFFTTKPVGSGTGMGLAIVHSIIVEKHQGKLTCNSTIGKGTEFTIVLPIRQL